MRRLLHALRSAVYKTRLEREMEEEIAFHLDMRQREGQTPQQARTLFGNVALATERMRDSHTSRLLESVEQDVRYALRALRRSPVFTAVAVISLALGIGANSAIFTVTNAVLLKMLAVDRPEALRLLAWTSGPKQVMNSINGGYYRVPGGRSGSDSFSYPVYLALKKNRFFEDLFAFKALTGLTTVIDGHSERTRADMVSGNLYSVLGLYPVLGRAITPQDDAPGSRNHVVVLGYAYWTRRFARDPHVLNSTMYLNTEPYTVIGVNPPSFDGFRAGDPVDLFVPLASVTVMMPQMVHVKEGPAESLLKDGDYWWLNIMGRLAPGVSEQQSIAGMNVVFQQAVRATLPQKRNFEFPKLDYKPGGRMLNRDYFRTVIYLFSGLVGVVLLIACANLASLLLARATSRTREIAVRLALGAGRWRLVRQIMTESVVLAMMGGVAGTVIGYFGKDVVPNLMNGDWGESAQFHFDYRVLTFTLLLSFVTAILFGLIPALRATRPDVGPALKSGGRSSTQSRSQMRVGKLLVMSQIALSILLLVAAGLFSRTLVKLRGVNLGFHPERVLLLKVSPPETQYHGPQRTAMFLRVLERLRAVPGVQFGTMSASGLVSNDADVTAFRPTGVLKHDGDDDQAYVHDVMPDYFQTMGVPMLTGRAIDRRDSQTAAKVAVINQALAHKFFGNENPIGKTFNDDKLEIIGICGDSKYANMREAAPPTFYRAGEQTDAFFDDGAVFALKTVGDPMLLARSAREAVSREDSNLVPYGIRSQEQQIDQNLAPERTFATFAACFGGVALLLACIGIYGIMAYNVARRTGEMGIRMALGAQKASVLGLILRETLTVAVVGVTLGLLVALVAGRATTSLLYDMKPYDPMTLAGAAVVMFLFAAASGLVPARRAASIEPGMALREE